MKRFIFFTTLIVLLSVVSGNAQSVDSNSKVAASGHRLYINLLGVQCGYEFGLSRNFTVGGKLGLASSYGWRTGAFAYSMSPYASAEARMYYNKNRRASRGKITDHNSGSFFAVEGLYLFNSVIDYNIENERGFVVSPYWGFQRVYKNRWLVGGDVGIHLFIDRHVEWGPRVQARFGIIF